MEKNISRIKELSRVIIREAEIINIYKKNGNMRKAEKSQDALNQLRDQLVEEL